MKEYYIPFSFTSQINRILIDLKPRTIEEIAEDFIKAGKNEPKEKIIKETKEIIEGNKDLYQKLEGDKWTLSIKNIPEHNYAFEILANSTKTLTTTQLRQKVSAKMPKSQKSDINLNLAKDPRFSVVDGKYWTLSEKIIIHDMVFEYLKNNPEPQTEKKLIKIICDTHQIEKEKVLFDPSSDKRFIKVGKDKWSINTSSETTHLTSEEAKKTKGKRQKTEIKIEKDKINLVFEFLIQKNESANTDEIMEKVLNITKESSIYNDTKSALLKALRRDPRFIPISMEKNEWTLEQIIPQKFKELPDFYPTPRIKVNTYLDIEETDDVMDERFSEYPDLLALIESEEKPPTDYTTLSKNVSLYERKNGILILKGKDYPFFPNSPDYISLNIYNASQAENNNVLINNKLKVIFGLEKCFMHMPEFGSYLSIRQRDNQYELRIVSNKNTSSSISKERIDAINKLYSEVQEKGLNVFDIIVEILKQYKQDGIESEKLFYEVSSLFPISRRIVYAILTAYPCFNRADNKKWYIDETKIDDGIKPEAKKQIMKLSSRKQGYLVIDKKTLAKLESAIEEFKNWEGREAYFVHHSKLQKKVKEKLSLIVQNKPKSEEDLTVFFKEMQELFYILNSRAKDPESGCWQLTTMGMEKWDIFKKLESANAFLKLIQVLLTEEDQEELDSAIKSYIEKDITGMQSSTLSPIFFCLKPQSYCAIHKPVRDGYYAITNNQLSPRLADYPEIVKLMREILVRYELLDFSDIEGFFTHCKDGKIELETYDELMQKYPAMKKAMDEISG